MDFLQSVYNVRNWGQQHTPQWARKAVQYGTPAGLAYKAIQATGVPKNMLSAERAQAMEFPVGQYDQSSLPQTQNMPNNTPTSTYSPTGGGGGSTAASEPTYGWWAGVRYNMSDPNQAEAYANQRRAFIEQNYGQGLSAAEKQTQQELGNLGYQRDTLGQGFTSNLGQLGKSKEQRDINIARYFSAIAPEMYQSAEGENIKGSQETYESGKTELQQQREAQERALGQQETGINDWWTNYQQQQAQQRQQDLDALYSALSESESQAVRNRIAGMATPTGTPTVTAAQPLNIQSYFDKLGQAIGAMPAQTANKITPGISSNINAILNKISAGQQLTSEEQALAQQYGIA